MQKNDIGKLNKFIDVFSKTYKNSYKKEYLKYGKKKLPEHILLQKNEKKIVFAFLYVDKRSFTSRIENLNHLILKYQDIDFYLIRDGRCSSIKGKDGLKEREKLSQAKNGNYIEIGKDKRVIFDLLDKMIDDIDNKNIDIDISNAVIEYCHKYNDFWLVELLK